MPENHLTIELPYYDELDQTFTLMQTIIQHAADQQFDQLESLMHFLHNWIIIVLQRMKTIYNVQHEENTNTNTNINSNNPNSSVTNVNNYLSLLMQAAAQNHRICCTYVIIIIYMRLVYRKCDGFRQLMNPNVLSIINSLNTRLIEMRQELDNAISADNINIVY